MTHNDALRLRPAFAHYERSHSLLHECATGGLIEYRRIYTPDRPVVFLEHRVLGTGGHPFADGWYLVCDEHLAGMNCECPEILTELCELPE